MQALPRLSSVQFGAFGPNSGSPQHSLARNTESHTHCGRYWTPPGTSPAVQHLSASDIRHKLSLVAPSVVKTNNIHKRSLPESANVNRRCNRIVRGQSVVEMELVLSAMGRGQRSIYTCSRHLSAILPSAMCNHYLGLLFHMHICRH